MKNISYLIILLMLASGCQTLTHKQATTNAQKRWGAVRASMKFRLAKQHYDSGLLQDAAATAIEALALDPSIAGAYVVLAQAQFQLGKTMSALQTLDIADEAGLDSAALNYVRGIILEDRGKSEEALDAFGRARLRDPENIDYLVAQVECLVILGRMDKALRIVEQADDRLSSDGSLSALAAHIKAANGEDEAATPLYRDALRSNGVSRVVAEELGVRLARSGQCEESLAVLTPIVSSTPIDEVGGFVLRSLASCHLSLGDATSARRLIETYAASHASDALAQVLLAKAALADGDYLTALTSVDRARLADPYHPEILLIRATIQWRRRRYESAAADLYDLLADQGEDADIHCLLGEVLSATGRLDAAHDQFEQALLLDPESLWANAGLEALAKQNDPIEPTERSAFTSVIEGEVANPAPE